LRVPKGYTRLRRQLEGIADAKARGAYRGRKASIDPAKVRGLAAQGIGATAIAKVLKIGRASVYRALGAGAWQPRCLSPAPAATTSRRSKR
jgi:DNA invertase Pin-like site-specific DNA recombinase